MKDLKNKNTKELQNLLGEKQVALRTFRFGIAGSNVRNVKEGSKIRKEIARIKTILNASENSGK